MSVVNKMTNGTPNSFANEASVRRLRGWLVNATDTEVQDLLLTATEPTEESPREPDIVTLPAPSTSPTHVTYLDQYIPNRGLFRRQSQESTHPLPPTQETMELAIFLQGGGPEEVMCIGGKTNVYYFPDMPGRWVMQENWVKIVFIFYLTKHLINICFCLVLLLFRRRLLDVHVLSIGGS